MFKYPWLNSYLHRLEQFRLKDHMPHAILLSGIVGIGKKQLAFHFIKTLICKNNNACGKCSNCLAQLSDKPDDLDDSYLNTLIRRSHYNNLIYCHRELSNSKKLSLDIKIDQIREFCNIFYKTSDKLKIGLIYYADEMNLSASNSLLKTLEEPNKNTLIILLAHSINKIPVTIISRCQHINIAPSYDDKKAINWLKITTNCNDDRALKSLQYSYGAPFLAQKWLGVNKDDYKIIHKNLLLLPSQIELIGDKSFYQNEKMTIEILNKILYQLLKYKFFNTEISKAYKPLLLQNIKIEYILSLLEDTYKILADSRYEINMRLLLVNILIVWSRISQLKAYPQIIYKNE